MSVWDTSTPAGSDLLSGGDDRIREMKSALQDALRCNDTEGVESVFPGNAPSTAPVFRYRGLRGTTAERPAAGQYGLFADTTKFVLQRDNGVSWDDIATYIPTGTKMVFYQASAPVGWTAVSVNDKFLRVVTAGGTGGSTGGSGLTPSSTITLAHTHTVEGHTHDGASHIHQIDYTPAVSAGTTSSDPIGSNNSDGDQLYLLGGAGTAKRILKNITKTPSSVGTTGSASPATDSQLSNTAFAYADVVVASKD